MNVYISGIRDAKAYIKALDDFQPGDICSVFTPDDSHFEIAKAALEKGLHVMVTKPIVKTLAEHRELVKIAEGTLAYFYTHRKGCYATN